MEYFEFNTEKLAQDFCGIVNRGEGYPLHEDSKTIAYCEPTPLTNGDIENTIIINWGVIKDSITENYYTE
jgi:hypothetical protein